MTAGEALEVLREIAKKNRHHGDTWMERIVYELDRLDERVLEAEMEAAHWKEKYDELFADYGRMKAG